MHLISVCNYSGHARIWPKPHLAKKSEFGQVVFVTAFGQTACGQFQCFSVLAEFSVVVVVVPGWCLLFLVGACWCLLVVCVCVVCVVCGGCVQDFGASPPDPPSTGPPKSSLFFFSLPPKISFFLLSLGGVLVEFWWCSEDQDPQMCTFGLSGCRVKPPKSGLAKFGRDRYSLGARRFIFFGQLHFVSCLDLILNAAIMFPL